MTAVLSLLAADAAHGGGGFNFMDLLIPDLATFVQSLILFTILAVVLWKFAWPSILHALEEREHHIKHEIETAEKNRVETERALKEYQAKLEASKAEAQRIIDEGKADALRLKDQILKEAREEGERLVKGAKREIELAEAKAAESLRTKAVDLAIAAAGRVLERSLKPEDHRDVASRFIQETERAMGSRS